MAAFMKRCFFLDETGLTYQMTPQSIGIVGLFQVFRQDDSFIKTILSCLNFKNTCEHVVEFGNIFHFETILKLDKQFVWSTVVFF